MALDSEPKLRALLDTWDAAEHEASRVRYGSPEWEEATLAADDARWTYVEAREERKEEVSESSRGIMRALEEIEAIEGQRREEPSGSLRHRELSARLRTAAVDVLRLAHQERASGGQLPNGTESIVAWELLNRGKK